MAHHDPRPCQAPPDWSGGYTSLFALQQGESWDAEQLAKVTAQHAALRGKTGGVRIDPYTGPAAE